MGIAYVTVTGRKRTISGLIRLVISLECFIEITPDFLCPFMNYMYSKFQSHSYWQSLVNLYNSSYTNVRFLPVTATYA